MTAKQSIRRALALSVVSLALTAAPALAQDVKTDYDHNVSFSQYHIYSWHKVQTTDPLFVDRIKQEVDKDLSAKGWQVVPQGGDVALTAVGATKNQQEYDTFYTGLGDGFGWRRGWGGGGFGDTTTTVEQIPVGTLVLDVYDPHSQKLLWRGTASQTLSTRPEKNIGKVNKAIDKMLDKFPPKGAM